MTGTGEDPLIPERLPWSTAIAEADPAGGALRYRGVDVRDLVGVVVHEVHGSAGGRKGRPDREADPACAARDDHGSVGEVEGGGRHQASLSMIMAIPWPPPTHMVSRPTLRSRARSPLSRVVVMRDPVIP